MGIVGAVFASLRFDGLVISQVRKDGVNSTDKIAEAIRNSKFAQHIRLVMLQGIAMAGFNVVDIGQLHQKLDIPVLIVARHQPDIPAIKSALLGNLPGGFKKWEIIKRTGPMEKINNVYVQRAGLDMNQAQAVLEKFVIYGNIPEPLRIAHLIAGAVASGQSRGRV